MENGHKIRYGFLKYCWAEQFSKLIRLLVTLNYNAQEIHLVAMIRSIEEISLQTLSFIAKHNKINLT